MLKIKNNQINLVKQALEAIVVENFKIKKGKGKLQNALKNRIDELGKDLNDINEVYFEKDGEGEFIREGNNLVWKEEFKDDMVAKKSASDQLKDLLNEEIQINLIEYNTNIKAFFEALQKDKFTAEQHLKDDDFVLLVEMLEDCFEDINEDSEEEK